MPFYVISHKDSLTPSQCDELAAAITSIHTILFTTPSLFVNVKFEDASAAPYYVGGKRVSHLGTYMICRHAPGALINGLIGHKQIWWRDLYTSDLRTRRTKAGDNMWLGTNTYTYTSTDLCQYYPCERPHWPVAATLCVRRALPQSSGYVGEDSSHFCSAARYFRPWFTHSGRGTRFHPACGWT